MGHVPGMVELRSDKAFRFCRYVVTLTNERRSPGLFCSITAGEAQIYPLVHTWVIRCVQVGYTR